MDESSLVKIIASQALEYILDNNIGEISKVVLALGAFSCANPFEIRKFWRKIIQEEPFKPLLHSKIRFKHIDGQLYCLSCDKIWTHIGSKNVSIDKKLGILTCPNCDSIHTQIKEGDSVYLYEIVPAKAKSSLIISNSK